MLTEAIRIAKRSPIRTHKTGAVIYDNKGGIISRGWSHPTTALVTTPRSMHAEMHAIMRAPPGTLRGSTIAVATLTRSGHITSGKPCCSVLKLIQHVGIKEIIYTERRVFA
jgi:deoxycytidylate deaminase